MIETMHTEHALSPADVDALRRDEFPVTERFTYLNHAALGPLPRRTAHAMATLANDFRDVGEMAYHTWSGAVERTRSLVARALNVHADEIAWTKNTSQGLSIVAAGVPWQPGDVVVAIKGDFPALVYPWLGLQHLGVEIRFVPLRNGAVPMDELAAALPGARLLAISWIQYSTGYRLDLQAVSDLCAQHGVLFCLDAIQGLGAWPLDLQAAPVDFCAFGGHKWLLSPQGIGALYVNRRVRDMMQPANVGWLGAHWGDFSAFDYDRPLADGAARYEEGTRSLVGIVGLEQSLGLLMDVSPHRIAAHITCLTSRLIEGLHERGYRVLTPPTGAHRSGIVTFAHHQRSAQDIFDTLRAAQVLCSVREGGVRISPHLYNTNDEIDCVLHRLTQ
jgi:selenocysteine lyase/cysteine desulfurase